MPFLETPGEDDLLHLPRRDWRTVCERLKRAGVRVRGRRGRSAIYVEDPNGYTVELYCD